MHRVFLFKCVLTKPKLTILHWPKGFVMYLINAQNFLLLLFISSTVSVTPTNWDNKVKSLPHNGRKLPHRLSLHVFRALLLTVVFKHTNTHKHAQSTSYFVTLTVHMWPSPPPSHLSGRSWSKGVALTEGQRDGWAKGERDMERFHQRCSCHGPPSWWMERLCRLFTAPPRLLTAWLKRYNA